LNNQAGSAEDTIPTSAAVGRFAGPGASAMDSNSATAMATVDRPQGWMIRHPLLARWSVVLLSGLAVALIPVPRGITRQSWNLLAIFVPTIVGSIVQPIPAGAIVLIAVTTVTLTGALTVGQALAGYADPIAWICLPAFFISRAMLKTGLGRRIALLFIRALGRSSLGLGYALVFTDCVLAALIPSNAARCGGVIFPIARSLAVAYDSEPGPTAPRLGAFLMTLIYQGDVIVCSLFLTGQVSNPLIAKLAKQVSGVELSYSRWVLWAMVPGLVSLLVIPPLLHRIFPPQIMRTSAATDLATRELSRMGPMSRAEKLLLLVFGLTAGLWMTTELHGIHYSVVALAGVGVLLVTGVLEWSDLLAEHTAWDVFIWYGGLVRLAAALGDSGITKRFAESAARFTVGWQWWAAMAVLLLVYFYAHYGFASITSQVTSMYVPFLVVLRAAGAPLYPAVLSLAYFSNLAASLTHYGTTPAPILFGAGYVRLRTWWKLGLIASIPNILIWTVLGFAWWKILGLW
jgi:divalent anion:Na+ symporter, DASS family